MGSGFGTIVVISSDEQVKILHVINRRMQKIWGPFILSEDYKTNEGRIVNTQRLHLLTYHDKEATRGSTCHFLQTLKIPHLCKKKWTIAQTFKDLSSSRWNLICNLQSRRLPEIEYLVISLNAHVYILKSNLSII